MPKLQTLNRERFCAKISFEAIPQLLRVCLASAYVQGNVVGADLRAARGG